MRDGAPFFGSGGRRPSPPGLYAGTSAKHSRGRMSHGLSLPSLLVGFGGLRLSLGGPVLDCCGHDALPLSQRKKRPRVALPSRLCHADYIPCWWACPASQHLYS